MKFVANVSLVCAAIFAFCGFLFGLLDCDTRVKSAKSAAFEQARAAAITVAEFAASDLEFAKPEKLENVRKRMGAEAVKCLFSKTGVISENGEFSSNEKLSKEGIFSSTVKTNGGEISATVELKSEEYKRAESEFYNRLFIWAVCGLIFGLATGLFISLSISRRIEELKNSLLSNGKLNRKARKVEFEELADLEEIALILREIESSREERESSRLGANNFGTSKNKILMNSLFPNISYEECGMRVSVVVRGSKCDGDFYVRAGEGCIVYGRVSASKSEFLGLAQAVLVGELSAKYLKENSPEYAYKKLSKIFVIPNWNMLNFCGDTITRIGYLEGERLEENFDKSLPSIFSTSDLGEALRFYAKLNLPSNKRFALISELPPENCGGIFVGLEEIKK